MIMNMNNLKLLFISLFVISLTFIACVRETSNNIESDGKTFDDTVAAVVIDTVKPTVNIYVENSGSMDGYVNGKTQFKGAIRDLLVMLKYYYTEENVNIYFINQKINKPVSNTRIDLAAFATNLEMSWRNGQRKSDWQSTNLNEIFKMILDSTSHNTVSILFSDCIYSIPSRGSAIGLLNDQKSLTKDAFLSKWRNDKIPLSTTIVKLNSNFDGVYYPFTGDANGYRFNGIRPYYIVVLANPQVLADFNKNIELKTDKIEGFDNKYVLSPEVKNDIYYTVLQSSYNTGRFKPDRDKSTSQYIRGIQNVDLNARRGGCASKQEDLLSFGIAVDLSNIEAEADYIKNIENYKVKDGNFSLDSIITIEQNKIHPTDWNRIASSNPTHIIIMTAKTKAVSNVSFVLKKQMPQWINDSNTEDDTNSSLLSGGKTFGLSFWVTGIKEAYETIYPNNNNFFECTISIKN